MPRLGDGLYRRGKAWYLDCRINGQRYQVRLGKGISRSVAAELANVKRAAILRQEAGIGRKRKDISFVKAKEAFLEWASTNKRPRTLRVYKQQLGKLEESFASKRLSQISAFDIERHKKVRTEQGARVVINRELAVLKNLFNKCILWGKFDGQNPVRGVKMMEEPRRRVRYLEPAEEAALLAVAPEPLRSLIIIGTNTGIRIGAEALTLKWECIDFGRKSLTVQAAYSKNGRLRNIPLNSRALEALQHLHTVRRSDYVFAKPNGQPYKDMEKPFRAACQAAGLAGTGVSPHTLRHTFASALVMRGVDLLTVQQYGGWATLDLVQRYAHLSASHKARAIETIAERFRDANQDGPPTVQRIQLAE